MRKSILLCWLEYLPALVALNCVQRLPWRIASMTGAWAGMCTYWVLPRYRRIAIRNIEIAFRGSYPPAAGRKLAKQAFGNFGRSIFEFIKSTRLSREQVISMTTLKSEGDLEAIVAEKKGTIVCTAHHGNLFWPMLYLAARGADVNLVIRPLDNPLLHRRLIKVLDKCRITPIVKDHTITLGRAALKRGEIVVLAVDQEATNGGIFVPFFNRAAATQRGISVLARWSKSKVVYVHHTRAGDQHVVSVSAPFALPLQGKEVGRHGDFQNLLLLHQRIEKVVAARPEEYLWLHPRWSKRPPGERDLYN
ncbi:hypothetical protein OAO01_00910 [Oligoflexia bacterium]|nr:hypothetical protein [Oligoflexia bacterium]